MHSAIGFPLSILAIHFSTRLVTTSRNWLCYIWICSFISVLGDKRLLCRRLCSLLLTGCFALVALECIDAHQSGSEESLRVLQWLLRRPFHLHSDNRWSHRHPEGLATYPAIPSKCHARLHFCRRKWNFCPSLKHYSILWTEVTHILPPYSHRSLLSRGNMKYFCYRTPVWYSTFEFFQGGIPKPEKPVMQYDPKNLAIVPVTPTSEIVR